MPLVGVIEPGSVARILRSVSYAKANVLLLLESEAHSAHLLYEGGQLVTARVDDLTGEEAVKALEQWSSGHYSLVKREARQGESKGLVLLNGLGVKVRRPFERWLKSQGFEHSIVGYPQQAIEVISYLQADVVVMHCPRHDLQMSCSELVAKLEQTLHLPPLLVVLEQADRPCQEPCPPCVRIAPQTNALRAVLERAWSGNRYGVRQATRERTAQVQQPKEPVAALTEVAALHAKDLLPMFAVLLGGSGVIWTLWWWLVR